MNVPYDTQAGFIKYIVIFIVLIAIITYFNIDIEKIVNSDSFQWALGLIKGLWQNFIVPATNFIFSYFERG